MTARRQADARKAALIREAASVCLSHPGAGFSIQLALVERAVRELDAAAAEPFLSFTAWAAAQDPYDLATAYVAAFTAHDRTLLVADRESLLELRESLARGDREGYAGHAVALIDAVLATTPDAAD